MTVDLRLGDWAKRVIRYVDTPDVRALLKQHAEPSVLLELAWTDVQYDAWERRSRDGHLTSVTSS